MTLSRNAWAMAAAREVIFGGGDNQSLQSAIDLARVATGLDEPTPALTARAQTLRELARQSRARRAAVAGDAMRCSAAIKIAKAQAERDNT